MIDLTIVGNELARIKNYAAAAKERSRLLRDKLAQKQQIRMNREWLADRKKGRGGRAAPPGGAFPFQREGD